MRKRCLPAGRRVVYGTVAATWIAFCGGVVSANAQATNWLTGARFHQELARPITIGFAENPLRRALGDLARTRRIAVILDRRVDPGQKINLQLSDLSVEEVLQEIARDRRLGVSVLGSVVYFGPPGSSSRLRTIAELRKEEIRRLPPDVARPFLLPKRLTWDDFAMPRALLGELARQNGWEIDGLDRIPHDLWAGADLPAISPVDRLTLILVQFDLTFQVDADGRSLALVPLPKDVALVRDYSGGTDPEATARKMAAMAPDARVKVVGDRVYVKGLVEDHQRITSPRRPPRQPAPVERSFAKQRFTLEVDHSAESLLRQLAKQLNLDLRIDEAGLQEAGISLQRHVTFRVEKATIDELLGKLGGPLGLSIRRDGNVVEIGPAD